MGVFDFLSGRPGRFVTERAFGKNLAQQIEMAPLTIEAIHRHGITPDMTLKLAFFFLTNAPEKAKALASRLKAFGYQVEYGVLEADKKRQLVKGMTRPMPMSRDVVSAWTRKMCEVGYANDCSFDGWEASGPR